MTKWCLRHLPKPLRQLLLKGLQRQGQHPCLTSPLLLSRCTLCPFLVAAKDKTGKDIHRRLTSASKQVNLVLSRLTKQKCFKCYLQTAAMILKYSRRVTLSATQTLKSNRLPPLGPVQRKSELTPEKQGLKSNDEPDVVFGRVVAARRDHASN